MASGVPVVTPASGAGWELVQRSGAGAGYEPGSPADMARAVIDVLGAPGNGWGGRARGYAEREHAWSTVFDRLFTTYREVLAR
jgi:glycosyltransferase involved in cell wall biosynthesis